MIVGPQIQITDAMITASNVSTAGEPAAYDAATTYAADAEVTYEDYVFVSLQSSNTGNTPPDSNESAWWVRSRAINKMKPFEHDIRRVRLYDQCANADTITYTIEPGVRFDMIGFFNLDAITVQVVVTSASAGEVFNETIDLADNTEIVAFWTHRFSGFDYATEKVFLNVPIYSDAEIEITIDNTGGIAKVGQICIAQQIDLGTVIENTELRSRSFSTVEQDFNGQFTSYVNRGSVRIIDYKLAVTTEDARRLQRVFARDIENKPVMFTAGADTEKFGTTVFGRGTDFRLPLGTTLSFTTITAEQFK